MKIRSLSHVGLTVSNFASSVKWYHDMFGFLLIAEQTLEVEQVEKLYSLYKLHNTKIRLGFLRAPKGGIIEIFEFNPGLNKDEVCWNKPGVTHITMDVKNIWFWYEKLKEKGIKFFSEPQNTDGNEWVFSEDPDGNLIELIDLKSNYTIIRVLGGIVGKVMKKKVYKNYY